MYFWSWNVVIMVMQYVDCGHQFMAVVIIFTTLDVKICPVVIKLAQFWLILVFREWFLRGVCSCFHGIYCQHNKKNCTSGGLGPAASSCHLLHLLLSASPRAFLQSHGLSVCKWPFWLLLVLSPRSTLRAVGCTSHLWKEATVSMVSGRTNQFFFVQTHRLVLFTRHYVLLCGGYSR